MFDNSVGLYFYSAVLQANTALIAFAAVFVVFKLQLLSQSLQNKDSDISSFIQNHFAVMGQAIPDDVWKHFNDIGNIIEHIRAILSDKEFRPSYRPRLESLENSQSLAKLVTERGQIVERQLFLRERFRWPILSVLSVIIVSLCILPFSYNLHKYYSNIELYIILFVVGLNIWALILNTYFVFNTIKK
jgi:uncharacterized membrane protein